MLRSSLAVLLSLTALSIGQAADGNRLAYLDGPLDPYYPHRDFPKLITPQWVGEEGVECVVTLAIDDMRESAKYEAFLRPILDRLKKIDGRAPVSIMSCRVDPQDPQLQTWLKEGLSIEVHTFDHPCPCLADGGLVQAKETYDKCVDLMNEIPGNKPVAFRMPCCDSKNTPSPRFWAEAFNKTTAKGNFLQIDSSVFNIITNKDKSLPKEITQLPDGTERFRRYVPFANFVNTIEDYPYPYVIGGMCWEFPCVVPSDWSAQHVQKPNNPETVRDWKLALDACVLKQGVFNLVFHPHGWIRNDQIVELIDHAVVKHGKKVKFLTFKECAERLNKNLLLSKNAVRTSDGPGLVQLKDVDRDGYLDIQFWGTFVAGATYERSWDSRKKQWVDKRFPPDEPGKGWSLNHLHLDYGYGLLRDIDGDGKTEVIGPLTFKDGIPKGLAFWRAKVEIKGPEGTSLFTPDCKDAGLRLIDINADDKLDCLFSNHERYSLHLFKDMKEGWAIKVIDGVRGRAEGNIGPEIPPFVRADGTNNGAWFHSGALWLQNEDTWRLPDHVFKLTFKEMLADGSPPRQQGNEEAAPRKPEPQGGLLDKPAVAPSLTRRAITAIEHVIAPKDPPKIEMTRPLSPEESLKALHVRPGFTVELVAAEPLVVDPVAFDWGPDGRLWVVEMRDYPNGITWKKEGDQFGVPGGRVKVLTDENGDGKYDKAAVFLDEIPFPTGVKVWGKGILVTAAPDVLYAEDKNGDDKADVKKVLYRGFGEGNQQHRVNGLRWGLDNWLYIGNGDSGGKIKSLAAVTPTRSVSEGTEVNVNGRDLRIRPDTGELDAQSGQTQFGRERDDWGNWFGGNNSDPMWHYTLEDHYLRRNPHFAPPSTHKQVSVSPGASPVFPRSVTLTRFNDENRANRFTSACGHMIYRDELLGPEFVGNSFVCEPVHNLVHREIVTPQGTSFTSRRAEGEETSEFLASEDSWFRPSMCRTGPDGALWVSDMYRFVIEHPTWIPKQFQEQLDLRAGDDKGRIYRIYPTNAKPRQIARLDKLDTAGLVAALDSPNGPQRDLVQQMLVWRADKTAVKPLEALVTTSKRPQARLQALCTLDGLAALTDQLLKKALADEHPGVRCNAVRLAEPRLADSKELVKAVANLAADADPHVRQQVAYSLGFAKDVSSERALASLLTLPQADQYVVAAAMSSLNQENIGPVLAAVLAADRNAGSEPLVEKLLAMAAAMGDDQALGTAVATLLKPNVEGGYEVWQMRGLAAVLDALARKRTPPASILDGEAKQQLAGMLTAARKLLAVDAPTGSPNWLPQAVASTTILARALDEHGAADVQALGSLLRPQSSPELQSAAIAAMARSGRSDVPPVLLASWNGQTPALRGQILDAFVVREAWAGRLLDAVEKGQIASNQIDARRRQQLVASSNELVRTRAAKLLDAAVNSNRQVVVDQYLKAAAAHSLDAAAGKAVFAKRCANCHRLEEVGHAVGPDLSALTDRSAGAMFVAVLDPNRAVEDKFLDYLVRLADGRTASGMLREETGTSITLAAAEGKATTILRNEIEQLQSSGKSLMPEGVEKDITPTELADLAAYLRSSAPPPKQLAGNSPEVVQPFVDGSIRLLATSARVYGPTVILEEKYRNLGWWGSVEDHCIWSFDNPTAREYRVVLDYACANDSAGNSAVVAVAGQTLGCVVEGTGTWDNYRGKDLGVIKLPAGPGELVVKPGGPIKNALLDLRGVFLRPVKE